MNLQSYQEVRDQIQDGDLLLYRRPGLIASIGRGIHSHAAAAAWWGDRLFVLEMLQFTGGRAVTLSSQVGQNPGRWDVYEANPDNRWPEYSREKSTRLMKTFCGAPYGWSSVLVAAARRLPLVRLLAKPNLDDVVDLVMDNRPQFCSEAKGAADKFGGGVDPVPNLANRLTEPTDLARSSFYRYKFTLEN